MNQDGDFKGLDLTNRNEEHKFGAPNASNEWFKIETGIVLIFPSKSQLLRPTRAYPIVWQTHIAIPGIKNA